MVRGGALSLRPWPRGSLAPCPLLTLTMTVASGGAYLLPVVVQVALGSGPRSFGESQGPLGANRHQPEQKEGLFGKKGGQGGLRAGEASGAFEEGPTPPD